MCLSMTLYHRIATVTTPTALMAVLIGLLNLLPFQQQSSRRSSATKTPLLTSVRSGDEQGRTETAAKAKYLLPTLRATWLMDPRQVHCTPGGLRGLNQQMFGPKYIGVVDASMLYLFDSHGEQVPVHGGKTCCIIGCAGTHRVDCTGAIEKCTYTHEDLPHQMGPSE
jgi:hypothetical protein